MRVDDVAHRLKTLVKPEEKVYARLLLEGSWLTSCQKLSETSLTDGDVIETVWASASPLAEQGNDRQEVLPRRPAILPSLDRRAGALDLLDLSGMYKLHQSLHEMEPLFTPSVQVLDIRQCGLKAPLLRQLLAQAPASLKEFRASRNFIDPSVLECLCERSFPLRVLDIGYSHCKDCSLLPRIGEILGAYLEELGVGDLAKLKTSTTLLAAAVTKCPNLKVVDFAHIDNLGFLDETFKSLAQHCPLIEAVYGYRTEPRAAMLQDFLSHSRNLAHLEVSGISAPETIRQMAELTSLRSLRLELCSSDPDMMESVCRLQVETLFLEFNGDPDAEGCAEDDIEFVLDLCDNSQELAKSFGKSPATCISLIVAAADPVVLQAVGSRLHELGPMRSHSSDHSILGALVQTPSCCVNLVRLSINFYEQIDAGTLATVAGMCPLLRIVQLNADEFGFQKTPIDEGVLALGRQCSRLEHLDF